MLQCYCVLASHSGHCSVGGHCSVKSCLKLCFSKELPSLSLPVRKDCLWHEQPFSARNKLALCCKETKWNQSGKQFGGNREKLQVKIKMESKAASSLSRIPFWELSKLQHTHSVIFYENTAQAPLLNVYMTKSQYNPSYESGKGMKVKMVKCCWKKWNGPILRIPSGLPTSGLATWWEILTPISHQDW